MKTYSHHRLKRSLCDCGNPVAVMHGGEWVCSRCRSLDEMRAKVQRRKSEGHTLAEKWKRWSRMQTAAQAVEREAQQAAEADAWARRYEAVGLVLRKAAVLLAFLALPCSASLVDDRLLDALAIVESGNNPAAIGRAGERGAYQFTRSAWSQTKLVASALPSYYRGQPWKVGAHDRATARQFARCYLVWLESRLNSRLPRRDKHTLTVEQLFCAWNLGLEGFTRRGFSLARCPKTTRQSAAKLKALYGN